MPTARDVPVGRLTANVMASVQERPAGAPANLWDMHLQRTRYADDLLARGTIELDPLSLALLRNADGSRPLRDMAIALDLRADRARTIAQKMLDAGLVVPTVPPQVDTRDPLSPQMREHVRRLRPVLIEHAGLEAAYALEVDAPECRDLADLVVRMRRRFIDPNARDRFTAAALQLSAPPRRTPSAAPSRRGDAPQTVRRCRISRRSQA